MVEKPAALVAIADVLPQTFDALKTCYKVKDYFALDLNAIDAIPEEQFAQHLEIAALSMRKIQLLYVISQRGVRTRADIVISLCAELVTAIDALLETTKAMEPNERQVLEHSLATFESVALVVGDMMPPGENPELE